MAVSCKATLSLLLISLCVAQDSFSQIDLTDSSKLTSVDEIPVVLQKNEQAYQVNKGRTFIYTKPKKFGFITNLPRDASGIVTTAFKKESIKPLLLITGTTLALLFADQPVTDGVRQFSENIHFRNESSYKKILSVKLGKTNISLLEAPQNLNTAIYQLGQGFPSLLLGAGLFTYGKIKDDYRALSTSSQLAEAFVLMGVGTQLIKRVSGRQSPSRATAKGGEWHILPSFKAYQNNTSNYDAFPSGHLATLMTTVTILSGNYPEKKYIKPVGYSVTGLVALAMINNNVHWVSDYPLAIGLGYLCARQVVNRSRKVVRPVLLTKHQKDLTYTLNYNFGRLMPGVIYRF